MMMARLISARDGRGVGLGVNVGDGVNVAVTVAVTVAVCVASEVGARVGVSLGRTYAVGEGRGGREAPQMLGMAPHPARRNESSKRVRRFREVTPAVNRELYFNIGIFSP